MNLAETCAKTQRRFIEKSTSHAIVEAYLPLAKAVAGEYVPPLRAERIARQVLDAGLITHLVMKYREEERTEKFSSLLSDWLRERTEYLLRSDLVGEGGGETK